MIAEFGNHNPSEDRGVLEVANSRFVWGERTYVMGIINVTPDSFSADGLAQEGQDIAAAALSQARRFAEEGADILDIGGESTRPGAQPVSIEEELRRVIPAIRAIRHEIRLPISIDTYHAAVAAAALDAGAHIINDIWGLREPEGEWNEPMATLAATRNAPIILMHNRRAQASVGAIGGHYADVAYNDLPAEIIDGLRERVNYARSRGIDAKHIIIDPGVGFGKTPEQNLVLLRRLSELRSLGLPLLLGTSRKSFIGKALESGGRGQGTGGRGQGTGGRGQGAGGGTQRAEVKRGQVEPHERDVGTAATTALAVQAGVDIVRVHNVQMNVQAAQVADAIFR
jgi:dihydropteroate synthase